MGAAVRKCKKEEGQRSCDVPFSVRYPLNVPPNPHYLLILSRRSHRKMLRRLKDVSMHTNFTCFLERGVDGYFCSTMQYTLEIEE